MKETLRKIDIITLCLVIIVVNLAYCYAQLKVFDKDYVNFFGYTIFQVITGSMEDTIKINDITTFSRISFQQILFTRVVIAKWDKFIVKVFYFSQPYAIL